MKFTWHICLVNRTVPVVAIAIVTILGSSAQAAPIGYWRFEETEDDAIDSAGPNDGAPQGGAIRTSTVFGSPVPGTGAANAQSMSFDGMLGTAVDTGQFPDTAASDFTIEAWINRSGDNLDQFAIIAGKNPSGNFADTGWWLDARPIDAGMYEVALISRFEGGTFHVARSTGFPLALGAWHHVAGVREDDELRIYVDGVQRGSAAVPSGEDYSDPLQTFSIGGGRGGPGSNWVGNFFGHIDEVRLSNTALSPDQFLNGSLSLLDGDLNSDGFVGQDDLNLVLAKWGQTVSAGDPADPDGDPFVGQDDLNPVLGDWGQGTRRRRLVP